LLQESAPQLLSPSENFETELNRENEDAIQNEALLHDLSHLAQLSFQTQDETPSASAPAPTPAPGPASSKATATSTTPSKARPASRDTALLEALMELRNSNRLRQRTPGMYSPILRAPDRDGNK
jgi:hypothetical protein